jgi:hypothetical protein
LFCLALLLCLIARHAFAQEVGGVDVTTTLVDLANIVVPGACITAVYFIRKWMAEHTGGQSEALDWDALNGGLEALAHIAVNQHLLAGKTVTIDTRSVLGNQLVSQANQQLAMEIKRLGLTDQTVATRAEAAIAKVLNTTPTAPPYLSAPAPAAPGAGA